MVNGDGLIIWIVRIITRINVIHLMNDKSRNRIGAVVGSTAINDFF